MACLACWGPEVTVVYQVHLSCLGPSTNSTDSTSQSYSCPCPPCLRLWTVSRSLRGHQQTAQAKAPPKMDPSSQLHWLACAPSLMLARLVQGCSRVTGVYSAWMLTPLSMGHTGTHVLGDSPSWVWKGRFLDKKIARRILNSRPFRYSWFPADSPRFLLR